VRCCATLRSLGWDVQCSRPASVWRSGYRFCYFHDPGSDASMAQAARISARRCVIPPSEPPEDKFAHVEVTE
jgi:hypothetical protein